MKAPLRATLLAAITFLASGCASHSFVMPGDPKTMARVTLEATPDGPIEFISIDDERVKGARGEAVPVDVYLSSGPHTLEYFCPIQIVDMDPPQMTVWVRAGRHYRLVCEANSIMATFARTDTE